MNNGQILYYDLTGQPVYSPAMADRTARSVGGSITLPPIGTYCADNNSFIVPPSITLTADNSAGVAAVTFKHASFDNIAEAILGEIGGATSAFFSVDELQFGAGTIPQQDGTNIFGDDALRRFTATYAIAVKEITITGTQVTNKTEQLLNVFKGNLTTVDQTTIKLSLDLTNSTNTPVLNYKGLWYLTSNKAFSILMGIGLVCQIRLDIAGFKPYTELF